MSILFFGCDQVLKRLLIRDPEAGKYVRCSIPVCALYGVEILEYIIHGTTYAVRHIAICMSIS